MLAIKSRSICKCPHLIILKAMYTLQNYLWMLLYFPSNALYLSQVEFLAIHPFYTNLLPTPIIISHHLFPAPFQFGTIFPTLLSLLRILLPLSHTLQLSSCNYVSLHILLVCVLTHSMYSVTRIHDGWGVNLKYGWCQHKCVATILKSIATQV